MTPGNIGWKRFQLLKYDFFSVLLQIKIRYRQEYRYFFSGGQVMSQKQELSSAGIIPRISSARAQVMMDLRH